MVDDNKVKTENPSLLRRLMWPGLEEAEKTMNESVNNGIWDAEPVKDLFTRGFAEYKKQCDEQKKTNTNSTLFRPSFVKYLHANTNEKIEFPNGNFKESWNKCVMEKDIKYQKELVGKMATMLGAEITQNKQRILLYGARNDGIEVAIRLGEFMLLNGFCSNTSKKIEHVNLFKFIGAHVGRTKANLESYLNSMEGSVVIASIGNKYERKHAYYMNDIIPTIKAAENVNLILISEQDEFNTVQEEFKMRTCIKLCQVDRDIVCERFLKKIKDIEGVKNEDIRNEFKKMEWDVIDKLGMSMVDKMVREFKGENVKDVYEKVKLELERRLEAPNKDEWEKWYNGKENSLCKEMKEVMEDMFNYNNGRKRCIEIGHGLCSPLKPSIVIMGRTGTGKTRVSKIYAEALSYSGIIGYNKHYKLYKCSELEKLGEEAIFKLINEYKGGVLIIDEAHRLVECRKIYNCIMDCLPDGENNKNKYDTNTIVLLGYEKDMNEFLHEDDGMARRLQTRVTLPIPTLDYLSVGILRLVSEFNIKHKIKPYDRDYSYYEQKNPIIDKLKDVYEIISISYNNAAIRFCYNSILRKRLVRGGSQDNAIQYITRDDIFGGLDHAINQIKKNERVRSTTI